MKRSLFAHWNAPLLLVVPLSLSLALAGIGEAQAQGTFRRDFRGGMRSGVGYTAAVPDAMAGVGVWHLFGSGRFGAFVDAKASFPSRKNDGDYCPPTLASCNVVDVELERNDVVIRDVDEYLIFNVGGIVALGPEFALLLGAGPVRESRYREYYDQVDDPEFLLTEDGSYYVPFDPGSSWTAQVVVGMMLRLANRFVLRFGYEGAPGGISFGAYWALPR